MHPREVFQAAVAYGLSMLCPNYSLIWAGGEGITKAFAEKGCISSWVSEDVLVMVMVSIVTPHVLNHQYPPHLLQGNLILGYAQGVVGHNIDMCISSLFIRLLLCCLYYCKGERLTSSRNIKLE